MTLLNDLPAFAEVTDAARNAVQRVRGALGKSTGVIPVVRLEGPIMSSGTGRGGLNLPGLESVLRRAFESDGAVAVALAVNSPGGSPAQSELIASRIRQLAAQHELPVLAFCEDVAASGGYWLACAADEIYLAGTTVVGSIGVISAGFGAVDLLAKLGLERRVFTAGDAKHRLDMFEEVRTDDVDWLRGVQQQIHAAFRNWVTERRGDRLAEDPRLFTGEVWIGVQAVELGLADGVGSLRGVLQERFPDAEITPMHTPKPLLARVLSGGGVFAGALVDGAVDAVVRRGMWSGLGL
jgi:signal peptide peptidase SppA